MSRLMTQTKPKAGGRVLKQQLEEAVDLKAAFNEFAIISIVDPAGAITFVNEKFCGISGYSREELIGKHHPLLEPGHHPAEFFRPLWSAIESGAKWHGQIKSRAKNGSFYWVEATIVPFPDGSGKPQHHVLLCSDITRQKQIELELDGKLRLQRLLANLSACFSGLPSDQADDAIRTAQQLIVETLDLDRSLLWQFSGDPQGMTVTHYWQRPGCPMPPKLDTPEKSFPWSYGQVLRGEAFSFKSIDDLPLEAAGDVKTFRSYGLKSNVTIPLVVDREVFGAIVFATLGCEREWGEEEITELKLVAQIIGNVVGRQRAEIRSEQLRSEIGHSARLAMLGELTAALAHELNQPLSAILCNAQVGQRLMAVVTTATDDREILAILEDIERDSKRAGGVVHNLRNMLSNTPVSREKCAISEIIEEVTELVHGEFVAEKIKLTYFVAEGLPLVQAVRVELQQILMNLLVNAMHAMEKTPQPLRAINIHAFCENESVVVSVRDHGHGISPTQLPHIFDPFYTTKLSGLGMGLAVCRRFVESHGGRIGAANHDDGGAIFSFRLPAIRTGK